MKALQVESCISKEIIQFFRTPTCSKQRNIRKVHLFGMSMLATINGFRTSAWPQNFKIIARPVGTVWPADSSSTTMPEMNLTFNFSIEWSCVVGLREFLDGAIQLTKRGTSKSNSKMARLRELIGPMVKGKVLKKDRWWKDGSWDGRVNLWPSSSGKSFELWLWFGCCCDLLSRVNFKCVSGFCTTQNAPYKVLICTFRRISTALSIRAGKGTSRRTVLYCRWEDDEAVMITVSGPFEKHASMYSCVYRWDPRKSSNLNRNGIWYPFLCSVLPLSFNSPSQVFLMPVIWLTFSNISA